MLLHRCLPGAVPARGRCSQQAIAAEEAGFDGISSSDHLQPWWEPGESGHTWPWLGAAGQATSLPIGTGVTSTGARYHPAMIAQAWVTLERLFPGRPYLGIGSGEALNEVPVGDDWPPVGDQIARMDEALSIIDRLWKGETITEDGPLLHAARTSSCTRCADRRPPIWISAFGPQAAEVAGRWGDGLWTLADPETTPEVLDAYRAARRRPARSSSRRSSRGRRVDEAAMESVRKWKGAQPQEHYRDDWHEPRKLYANGEEQMSDDELAENAIIGSDLDHHVERIRELEELGATVIVLQNNSGADPLGAIEVYGEHVLPALRGVRA